MDQRHEIGRRHKTTDRMPPANKRFRAHQPTVVEADLRLIEKFELLSIDSALQLSLKRQPDFEFIPDRTFEDDVTSAAGGLGPVKREIGIAKELVRRRAVLRIDGHTDAGIDAKLSLTDGERDFSERNRYLFGQLFRPLRHIGPADHDGELITA